MGMMDVMMGVRVDTRSPDEKQDTILELVPEMMARVMMHCLENMLPLLPEEPRAVYAASIKAILDGPTSDAA